MALRRRAFLKQSILPSMLSLLGKQIEATGMLVELLYSLASQQDVLYRTDVHDVVTALPLLIDRKPINRDLLDLNVGRHLRALKRGIGLLKVDSLGVKK